MKKVNKKKGFTLAELLVVIAILAILVAVAVPIFTGVLSDAEETVENANIRAVRGAAVAAIMTSDSYKGQAGPWVATAKVDGSGNVTNLKVKAGTGTEGVAADGTVTANIESLTFGASDIVLE